MRIPLHIDPKDQSKEANEKRLFMAMKMAELNPQGFRNRGRGRLPTYIEKLAAKAGFGE